MALPNAAWRGRRPSRQTWARVLSYSWALPIGGAASLTVTWADTWVIRYYLGNDAVGLYTWAYRVTAITTVFSPLTVLLTPAIVDARLAGDLERLNRYGQRSLRLVVLAGLAGLSLLATVFPFMTLLVGPAYGSTYPVILILLSAVPFQLLRYLTNPLFNAFEYLVAKGTLFSVGVAVANVVADFLLVPRLGIVGAAVATAIVFSASGILSAWLTAASIPGLRLPPLRHYVCGGLIMPLGAVSLLAVDPGWGTLLCVGLGLGALWSSRRWGVFSLDDIQWLEAQPVTRPLKWPLVLAARWLAGPQGSRP